MAKKTEEKKGMSREEQAAMIAADANSLMQFWATRNNRILADRDIVNLVPKNKKTTDKLQWQSNEPKVFYYTATSLLSAYPPRFRLPKVINMEADQEVKMDKAERFLIGAYRSLDNKQMDIGETYWLWKLAYWILSGYYAVESLVTKNGEGETEFCADIFDPMTVYPKWDNTGLIICPRIYEIDNVMYDQKAESYGKVFDFDYKKPSPGQLHKVIDYWVKQGKNVYNGVMVGDMLVKPLTRHKNLYRIPIHCGTIGSPDRVSSGWQEMAGENIIGANRDMYDYTNTMASLMATIMAENTYPNIVTKTRTGRSPMQGKPPKGYGEEINLKIEDSLELWKHATTPEEAQMLMQWVDQRKQQGSMPNVVYGNLPVELSGFAISQLMAAIRYKLGPYLNTMQYVISRIMTDFMYQYRTGNFPKVQLNTASLSDLKRGQTFVEEFTKEDIPEATFVEVTIPISSQFDKTQQILNARQALSAPQLLSRKTIWEQDLDIQDTEQELARIREDQLMDDPFIKQIEILEGLRKRVGFYVIQGDMATAQALKQYIMSIEMQMGMRQGIPQAPGQGGGAPGVPPQQMPAEARNSPDQMNAMVGRGPSGLNRRPQTPEERAAGQGRKGILVSPQGDQLL